MRLSRDRPPGALSEGTRKTVRFSHSKVNSRCVSSLPGLVENQISNVWGGAPSPSSANPFGVLGNRLRREAK